MTLNEIKSKKEVVFGDLANYPKMWFLGAFNPAIINTNDFEAAIFDIKKNHESDLHWHEKATELNLVISGECLVTSNGVKTRLKSGGIFIFPPKVKTCVKYTKDTKLLVIKFPSIPFGDKFYDKPKEDDEG